MNVYVFVYVYVSGLGFSESSNVTQLSTCAIGFVGNKPKQQNRPNAARAPIFVTPRFRWNYRLRCFNDSDLYRVPSNTVTV